MGDKALTWQQGLIVVLCIGVLAGAGMGFGANIPDGVRLAGYITLGTSLALIALLTWSHLRTSRRPDVQPDVLASLFGPAAVMEAGDAHWRITGGVEGTAAVLSVVVQNLFGTAAQGTLYLHPEQGGTFLPSGVPALAFTLGPGEVAAATLRVPLAMGARAGTIKLALRAEAKASGGSRVRFGRRSVMSKKVNPGLTAALLLTGTIYAGGGTSLSFAVDGRAPLAAGSAPPPPPLPGYVPAWRVATIWSPGDDVSVVADRLDALT